MQEPSDVNYMNEVTKGIFRVCGQGQSNTLLISQWSLSEMVCDKWMIRLEE